MPSKSDRVTRKTLPVDLLRFFKTLLSFHKTEIGLAWTMVEDSVVERFGSIMLRLDRSAVGWQSSVCASERLLIFGKGPYVVETSSLTSKCETDLNLLI